MSVFTVTHKGPHVDGLNSLVPNRAYERTQARLALVPAASSVPSSVIGTAFDYAVRFELELRSSGIATSSWAAEDALYHLERGLIIEGEEHLPRLRKRVRNARIFHRKHLKRQRPNDAWMFRLSRHALRLARIDPLLRGGRGGDKALEQDDAAAPEIVEMLKLVPFERWAAEKPLLLNPTFGEASRAIGGADCDLIVGNRLIELKTLKDATLERVTIRELTVYLMLAEAARAAGEPFPKIEYVGVYFARHGHYWEMPTAPILSHPEFAAVRERIMNYAPRAQPGLGGPGSLEDV